MRLLTLLLAITQLISHEMVSIYAVQNGKVLIDQASDLSLTPASCLKLVTTGAALHILGPDLCFETDLEYDGHINEAKTLHGNLYIRGGGDPCLGLEQIALFVSAVEKLGIRHIQGRVIGDATRWEKALAAPGWCWEDLGNYYGAGASALSFHSNCYSLVFKPAATIGAKASILNTDPPLLTILYNEVTTGPPGSGDRACIYGSEFSPVQFVRGTIPAGVDTFTIKGAIPDPAALCAHLLTQALQKANITISNQELTSSHRTSFYTIKSPTVQEIVHQTNQKSNNLYAEHLLKKMGEVQYNEGSTAAGLKAVVAFWESQGIDLGGFQMKDGAGLSRTNLITTKQLVAMLLKMKQSKTFVLFFDSLPQVKNGIKAKSGSMALVNGYAGYANDITFAILINNCTSKEKRAEILSQFFDCLSN